MKKSLLSFGLFFLTLQLVSAQEPLKGTSLIRGTDFVFGGKLSFILADVSGDGLIGNGPLPGFQLGGVLEIPIRGEFYFAPEVLYSLQGTRGAGDNIRLGYLSFPLMGKYYISETFAIEVGPQLGFLLTDNLDDFLFEGNTFDLGLGLGGGYRLNDNFYFQLRFNVGLLKVIKNVKATNLLAQVGVVYYFL